MCLLPDKSIFCYGNYPASPTAFILHPDNTIKQLSDGDPSSCMGAVYHDGFIYLFGGWNASGDAWNEAANMSYQLISGIKFVLRRKFLV
ncbi:unnamed protein product [Blepharisma stoltei]|uniref:Uncharacterized protein n=1 Tax=Blepharisma stoltei TaxID=1481888 RepID=A0AAU9JQT5_9CILI|nr:unnamed protein product [Blepharisma stoltei]